MGPSLEPFYEGSIYSQFFSSVSPPPSKLPIVLVRVVPTLTDPPHSTYTDLADPPRLQARIVVHFIRAAAC